MTNTMPTYICLQYSVMLSYLLLNLIWSCGYLIQSCGYILCWLCFIWISLNVFVFSQAFMWAFELRWFFQVFYCLWLQILPFNVSNYVYCNVALLRQVQWCLYHLVSVPKWLKKCSVATETDALLKETSFWFRGGPLAELHYCKS